MKKALAGVLVAPTDDIGYGKKLGNSLFPSLTVRSNPIISLVFQLFITR